MSSDAFEQRDTGTQMSEFDDHCIGVDANDWRDAILRESLDGWRRRNKGLHSGWNNPLRVVHSRSMCMWCMHRYDKLPRRFRFLLWMPALLQEMGS